MSGFYIGVDGKARKVKGGYIGIDGVARKIKKGYIGVDGVARLVYQSDLTLADIPVGASVFLNENNTPTEYMVVNQGLPSSAYDASCDGTWLLRKNIHKTTVPFDDTDNDYGGSHIHNYLNSSFLSSFNVDLRAIVKSVRIPYHKGPGIGGFIATGAAGLSTRVFLLGCCELGWTPNNNPSFPADGSCLDYFKGTAETDSKRIAQTDEYTTVWWTRSPATQSTGQVVRVNGEGTYALGSCHYASGVRPALVLPDSTLLDENLNVIA